MIFPRRLSVPPSDDTAPTPPLPVAKLVDPPVRDYEHVYADDDGDDEFDFDPGPRRPRRLARYVRVLLLVMATGFTAVIVTALCLNPYQADGTAKTMETHRQLGLPRCNSVEYFGKPCPACGMTTSFALLTHGDVVNSLKANWVGTLLCAGIIVVTPWAVASAVRGRLLWVRNGELFATVLLTGLLALMVGRWAWIMFVQ
jgi:hypothetical protein